VLPIYLLTDYGLTDEFVGVLKAVILRMLPGATIVDLNHCIPPFNVLAGARCLERCVAYLGEGVVLAVVDPQVGTGRRGIAVEARLANLANVDRAHQGVNPTPEGYSRLFFVGPDNGLLLGAIDKLDRDNSLLGEPRVVEIDIDKIAPPFLRIGTTFDGRDLFAPTAALLARGVELHELGDPLDFWTLFRPPDPHLLYDGSSLEAEIVWVDRFGNIQLSATSKLEDTLPPTLLVNTGLKMVEARKVQAFDELDEMELGVMTDSNGYLALVVRQANAAELLGVSPGEVVSLSPRGGMGEST